MFARYVSENLKNYLKSINVLVFDIPKKYRKVSVY